MDSVVNFKHFLSAAMCQLNCLHVTSPPPPACRGVLTMYSLNVFSFKLKNVSNLNKMPVDNYKQYMCAKRKHTFFGKSYGDTEVKVV